MTLKEFRTAAGLNQGELAQLSGVNIRQIQRVEGGTSDINNLTAKNLLALANALGVAPEELTDDAPAPARILRAKDIFTREAYEGLTAEERRSVLKCEQAKEYSGLRKYPSACSAVFARIPDDWWGRYSARHIGEVAALLKAAYDDGYAEKSDRLDRGNPD